MKARIIGGPWPHALGQIGEIVDGHCEAYWIEFENIVFESADPGQYANRSWFFSNEIEKIG